MASGVVKPAQRSGLALWLWWVLATSVLVGLTYFVAGALVTFRVESDIAGQYNGEQNFMTGDFAIGSALTWACLLLFLVTPSLGLAQGLVLWKIQRYHDWRQWAFASTWGLILAAITVVAVNMLLPGDAGVILPGAVLGFAQWTVLRRSAPGARWWIVGSGTAWLVALATSWIVTINALPQSWISVHPSWPFYPLSSLLYWSVAWIVAISIYAGLTGLLLIHLLRSNYHADAAPNMRAGYRST